MPFRFRVIHPSVAALLALALSAALTPAPAAEPLTLERAEQFALAGAPWYAHHRRNVAAAAERAEYMNRLPDPQLTLGAVNLPVDSLSLDDEDMTMLMVGVRQQFPPGATLELRGDRARADLGAEEARLELEARRLLRELRETWLELYYLERALATVRSLKPLRAAAVRATEGRYRAGVARLQEVLMARQESARLADREQMLLADIARQRARLARWIGDAADAPLPDTLPELTAPAEFDPGRHPALRAADAELSAARVDIDIARQEYKPGFMAELSYGARRDRPDMVTAMVTMDLPIAPGKRQDRRVTEKRINEDGARLAVEDMRRELDAEYRAARAAQESLGARLRIYRRELLPDARRAAEVTVSGFARDQNELRDARIQELEAGLEFQRLQVELAKTGAQLLYFTGESQP